MSNFTPIPQAELDVMRAREEAATEGPWEDCGGEIYTESGEEIITPFMDYGNNASILWCTANKAFIAHARKDQPRLRIAYEAAQADNERLREGLRELTKENPDESLMKALYRILEGINALLDGEGSE